MNSKVFVALRLLVWFNMSAGLSFCATLMCLCASSIAGNNIAGFFVARLVIFCLNDYTMVRR